MTRLFPIAPLLERGHDLRSIMRAASVKTRAAAETGLTCWQADRAAIRLTKLPPWALWPDWTDDVDLEELTA